MTDEEIASIFAAELARHAPLCDQVEVWPAARLRMRTYIGQIDYPATLARSARAVVFKGSKVVVVRQTDGHHHICPGGHLEPGETIEAAARREVLEETGWTLGALTPLGFHHFQHLGERPADFPFRWGDFVQPIFVAEAVSYRSAARDRGQLEAGSRLNSIRAALAQVAPRDAAVLRAAIEVRATFRKLPTVSRRNRAPPTADAP
ncbi:MAG TPA: NUDIX domain-containing protein [Caulobacteraceae bacterium]|jgi:ADP-ribose pyrophosphatase YjhB (NUDIX family)